MSHAPPRPTLLLASALLTATLLLPGCLGSPAQSQTLAVGRPIVFSPPVDLVCKQICGEPSLAVDGAGRIFESGGVGDMAALLVSSDNGASFQPIPGPPPLGTVLPWRDDPVVQAAPDGSIWFAALVGTPNLNAPGADSPQYRGLQVARTHDGGRTWSPNTVWEPGDLVDRPWLAFGGGKVYLTWQTLDGKGSAIARSDDQGKTFQTVARMPDAAATGAPCVMDSGRVAWPVVGHGLQVRLSDDEGATWSSGQPLASAGYFPSLVCQGRDLAVATYLTQGIQVDRSTDNGTTWSVDPRWEGLMPSPSVSPALLATPAGLAVASFQAMQDGTFDLEVHRLDATGSHAAVVALNVPTYWGRPTPNTDYATLVALPDGRLATAWSDGPDLLHVAVEQG